jgi:hypothetical protein
VRTVKLVYPETVDFDSRFTILKGLFSSTGVGPHSLTTRLSLSVPAGQRAVLLNGLLLIMRDVAPTTAGVARAVMEVTGVEIVSEIREVTATTGAPRINQVPRGNIFDPGQTITIRTADSSTGGSYIYVLSASALMGPLT